MTDKEKINAIRAEVQNYIDAAHKAHTNITEGNFAHLLSFIDSLQEEPVSEDLNKAASRYAKKEYDRKSSATLPDRCRGCYAPLMYAFKSGAKWQKEQDKQTIELAEDHAMLAGMEKMKEEMMAKAFPVEIDSSRSDGRCILSGNFARFETGDKVKVIVIKQD